MHLVPVGLELFWFSDPFGRHLNMLTLLHTHTCLLPLFPDRNLYILKANKVTYSFFFLFSNTKYVKASFPKLSP